MSRQVKVIKLFYHVGSGEEQFRTMT